MITKKYLVQEVETSITHHRRLTELAQKIENEVADMERESFISPFSQLVDGVCHPVTTTVTAAVASSSESAIDIGFTALLCKGHPLATDGSRPMVTDGREATKPETGVVNTAVPSSASSVARIFGSLDSGGTSASLLMQREQHVARVSPTTSQTTLTAPPSELPVGYRMLLPQAVFGAHTLVTDMKDFVSRANSDFHAVSLSSVVAGISNPVRVPLRSAASAEVSAVSSLPTPLVVSSRLPAILKARRGSSSSTDSAETVRHLEHGAVVQNFSPFLWAPPPPINHEVELAATSGAKRFAATSLCTGISTDALPSATGIVRTAAAINTTDRSSKVVFPSTMAEMEHYKKVVQSSGHVHAMPPLEATTFDVDCPVLQLMAPEKQRRRPGGRGRGRKRGSGERGDASFRLLPQTIDGPSSNDVQMDGFQLPSFVYIQQANTGHVPMEHGYAKRTATAISTMQGSSFN